MFKAVPKTPPAITLLSDHMPFMAKKRAHHFSELEYLMQNAI